MSESLDRRAELAKLARLLEVPEGDLSFLTELPSRTLSGLRDRIVEVVYAGAADRAGTLVAASRLLPPGVAARIAQAVFEPRLSAQVATRLTPDQAGAMVGHLRTRYLADMAAVADPRRVAHLMEAIPAGIAAAVAREMVRREDHLAAGRLVSVAPAHLLGPLVDAVDDDESLLRIAFFLEDRSRLDEITGHVSDRRIAGILAAAGAHDLWAEGMLLMGDLGHANTRRVAAVAAAQPPELLDSLVVAATGQDLWSTLLPLVRHMPDSGLDVVANLPHLRTREGLVAAAHGALASESFDVLARVARHMDAEGMSAVMASLEAMPPEAVGAFIDAVQDP